MTSTFTQTLQDFRTEMNIKYPPVAVAIIIVQEMVKGIVRGRYEGRDSGRYVGRDRGSGIFDRGRVRGYIPKLRPKLITLVNGKRIIYTMHILSLVMIYTTTLKTTSKKISIKK